MGNDQKRITLLTFGFKYGRPPCNYFFDVSFLKNPAREKDWDLFSKPCANMRKFVLEQENCIRFIDTVIPLLKAVTTFDDDARIGLGCSSGRHRSYIIADEIKRRLESDDVLVKLIHREEQYQ